MKEIGGYLGLDEPIGEEYYKNLISLNTARNALVYLIKAKKIKKVYIPYFLCESVKNVLEREGFAYEQYHIDNKLFPKLKEKLQTNEYLYFVNYFGAFDNETICAIKEKYQNVIVDNVQAFFQKPVDGVDTIYSCRKFFGVPDGAYLSTNSILNEDLDYGEAANRMKHILGRYETETASLFYSDFKENDSSFKNEKLKKMSKISKNLLSAINYEKVKAIREGNYCCLKNMLGAINSLNFDMPTAPYVYPFYCKNGMTVKRILAENKIYVATLWPNVLGMEGTIEKDFAENILPLPCDQRYNFDDMKRIVEEILKCLN